jgi:hypothetical protein
VVDAFTSWLQNPGRGSAVVLGGAIGLALMSKLTSFLFLAAAAMAILACKRWIGDDWAIGGWKVTLKRLTAATALGIAVLWAGYSFSIGHVREGMGLSAQEIPSFHIPAPAFWRRVATIWVLNKTSPPAYLLGHIRQGAGGISSSWD